MGIKQTVAEVNVLLMRAFSKAKITDKDLEDYPITTADQVVELINAKVKIANGLRIANSGLRNGKYKYLHQFSDGIRALEIKAAKIKRTWHLTNIEVITLDKEHRHYAKFIERELGIITTG